MPKKRSAAHAARDDAWGVKRGNKRGPRQSRSPFTVADRLRGASKTGRVLNRAQKRRD
jgi:hypothetical protein